MKTVLFIIIVNSVAGFAQNKKDWGKYDELLRQGKFDQVYVECKMNLKEPYGKTSYLNHYYIGQSLCGKGYTQQGIGWYRYIKQKFPIDRNFGNQLSQSINTCGSHLAAPVGTTVTVIINNSITPSGVTGGVRGKSGLQMACEKSSYENYDKLRANDSLSRRVFPITQKASALSSLRQFLPESIYNIDTTGRFMLVYQRSPESSTRVNEVAAKLEMAYQYFTKNYKLRDIDKLFTVYLVEDKYSLQRLAKRVHDITISEGNIGYSSLNDLSLLGIANTRQAGTLIHELFHLVIRSDIGDVPPWLDEGMACMYSVYQMDDNKLRGSYETWRVTHFKMLINLKSLTMVHVPSLAQLLNYTWDEYQGEINNSFCDASVNYALSNFFALYLQYKDLDVDVIQAFRNRASASLDTLSSGPSDIELLETILGKPINMITADFYMFLIARYRIDMPKLLEQRPIYSRSDMPARFQILLDSVNIELLKLSTVAKTVKKKDLKALRAEKSLLFGSIARQGRLLAKQQEEVIVSLSESSNAQSNNFEFYSDMYQNKVKLLVIAEKEYEIFLVEAERQCNALIKMLRNKRQSPQYKS
jgi:hypothetical protein